MLLSCPSPPRLTNNQLLPTCIWIAQPPQTCRLLHTTTAVPSWAWFWTALARAGQERLSSSGGRQISLSPFCDQGYKIVRVNGGKWERRGDAAVHGTGQGRTGAEPKPKPQATGLEILTKNMDFKKHPWLLLLQCDLPALKEEAGSGGVLPPLHWLSLYLYSHLFFKSWICLWVKISTSINFL